MTIPLFKDKSGLIYHSLALAYTLLAYGLGFAGLFSDYWLINVLGTLLLAHGMIISGYMLHECAHNTIFKNNEHNARLGRILMWLNGSCYGTYEDVRYKHFRHHVDNGDLCWFDYQAWFKRHPMILKIVLALEWLYIPAHELVMHGLLVFGSFIIPQRKSQRLHNVAIIIIRGSLYGTLLWFYPRAAILYSVAYMLMLIVLRFMDNLQHDYASTFTLFDKTPLPHKSDREYEQIHTFSNPISLTHKWPNLLVLNFGFHNAHHARPTTPWFRLPALHRELYGENPADVIPFFAQVKCYSRYRVARVMTYEQEGNGAAYMKEASQGLATGINAVSFLTAF
ncbi:fatty acid desaturase [Sulfuriferula thiophila]|uniref:fatty acid desaturase n=1 Tax=Sulfuriferula thiophila TaxID=1781211 RepID=UPI000F6135BF|nr:fatty acid desaturase [Sulfuriferula thiophila]